MMDTTLKYIKMCEKAGEIQSQWFPILGDYYYYETGAICIFGCSSLMDCRADRKVRLPRQDQLQEMADYNLSVIDALQMLIAHFYSFTDAVLFASDNWQKHQKYLKQFNSMEQLWLAYIMHEKYGKVWDDEKNEWLEKCPTNAHTFKQEKGDLNNGES